MQVVDLDGAQHDAKDLSTAGLRFTIIISSLFCDFKKDWPTCSLPHHRCFSRATLPTAVVVPSRKQW
jgi:hypothetical protein